MSPDYDVIAVGNAHTGAEQLTEIAMRRIDLHPQIAAHPNAAPDLLDLLKTSPNPATAEALAQRNSAPAAPRKKPISKKHRKKSRVLPAITAVLALGVVGLGAFLWWLAQQPGELTSYTPPPTNFRLIDISTIGEGFSMIPATEHGEAVASLGDLKIMRFANDDQEALVAIDDSDTAYPQWATMLPEDADDVQCGVVDAFFHCGDTRIDPNTGAMERGDDYAAQLNDAEAAPAPAGTATQLTATASASVPFSINNDGRVQTSSGDHIGWFIADSPVITVHAEASKSFFGKELSLTDDFWAITDGQTVIGVHNDEVAWQQDLGQEAPAANGFPDAPQITLHTDTLLVADEDKLLGIDLVSGQVLWTIEQEFRQWFTDGSQLFLDVGPAVVRADLPEAKDGHRPQDARTQVEVNPPKPEPLPDDNALLNAKLPLPPACQEYMFGIKDPSRRYQFTNGSTRGEGSNAQISIQAGAVMIAQGRPLLATQLRCYGGGSYEYDSVAIYDPDQKLVATWEALGDDGGDIQGEIWDVRLEDFRTAASKIAFTLPSIGIFGDESCHGCGRSASAHIQLSLIEDDLVLSDIVYGTPQGNVKQPRLDEVQQFYDAVATSDDETALKWTTEDMLQGIDDDWQTGDPEDPYLEGVTVRTLQFPVGGKVDGCVLATASTGGIAIPGSDKLVGYFEYATDPGDFVCGVNTSASPDAIEGTGDALYNFYLVVKADESGAFTVTEFGRTFS